MFLFPKIVEERKSKFNGSIKVLQALGKYSLTVDNLTQSGGLLIPIWKKGLSRIQKSEFRVQDCLILGLGGGTSAQLVSRVWSEAKITAIEIDPVMVELGKKYMGLSNIKNLKIIIRNAFREATSDKLQATRFDLILVDMYKGKQYPSEAKSKAFFNRLHTLLAPQGVVIFNRLNWGDNSNDIQEHIRLLKEFFPMVTSEKILSNILVYCSHGRYNKHEARNSKLETNSKQ